MSSLQDLVNELSSGDDGELLVLSLDIGTTQSGAALAYIAPEPKNSRPPAVLERLPGQAAGKAKIPSVLLYGKDGTLYEKWGSQAIDGLSREEQAKLNRGDLIKSEWFKLYIDPEGRIDKKAFVSEGSKKLPPKKTGFEIWGDFLGKLSGAAKRAAKDQWAISWIDKLEKQGKVKYIVSIPVAWQKDPVTMMALRKQALRVGLITKETASCLSFCSESEASALHCYDQVRHLNMKPNDNFLVIDAGGGTVDFTSYKVSKTKPLDLAEIGPESKVCLYHGSTYVDQSFKDLLATHLKHEYPSTKVTEKHIKKAMSIFTNTCKPGFSGENKVDGFWDISDNDGDFDEGGIEVPWILTGLAFKPHVELVVDTASAIAQSDKPKYIFCSGGFGDSPYLRERLETIKGGVQIVQPEQTASSSGSKAVTLGACLYGLRTWVQKRITSKCIGCRVLRKVPPGQELTEEQRDNLIYSYGYYYIDNIFKVIIEHNQIVDEKDYCATMLTRDYEYPFAGPGHAEEFQVLESTAKVTPEWTYDEAIKEIGSFQYFVPRDAVHEIEISPTGVRLIKYTFEIRVYGGETELRAAIYSNGEMLGKTAYLEGGEDVLMD